MIELDQTAFSRIARIARHEAGLDLNEAKIGMVHARLQRRLRKLGIPDYKSYCSLIEASDPYGREERQNLVEALTTNVTFPFREAHHFPLLIDAYRAWASAARGEPFRVWSAGCSNGAELVSICLALLSEIPGLAPRDIDLFGTDIDGSALATAREGLYETSSLPVNIIDTCGASLDHHGSSRFKLIPAWKSRLSYERASLLDPPIDAGPFDVIFCRNVTIYFDRPTSANVQRYLVNALRPGGLLCLGHSERPADPDLERQCQRVGPTAYTKTSESAHSCR